MLYAEIHSWLGWPGREEAFNPSGAGARVHADFARKKIEGAMRTEHPGVEVNVGIIAADPSSDSTEAPLAVVCEFPRAAGAKVLDLAHKLAWNFSRTALLVTLEPHQIIAWSCYQDPTKGEQRRVCEMPTTNGFSSVGTFEQRQLRDLLHWINLITHRAQNIQQEKFPADGRADALLLKNLRYVRGELLQMGLAQDHCHDLLARVIFTQFLFHRKDSGGHAFFSKQKMQRLHEDGVLSEAHNDLASVLSHRTDTYALFRWMDDRFNGDLFPGKAGDDDDERESAWRAERKAVSKDHLNLLAGLIRGDLDVADKQHTLWPFYSFDTIPLEFISSVYEEFLTAEERGNDKAYYTPSHLVDYVLDAVLPWNSTDWDVRILDPCCGSAIFLVKAFQRLIHRWRRAHPGKDPLVSDLRPILENNLVGVDKNPEAVRVACFSLYLAMADAIEPKHYVTRDNVKVFPRLRGTRLIHRDFFDDECVVPDVGSFDCVLGNAPWGDGSILPTRLREEKDAQYRRRIASLPPTSAQQWARANDWPVANKDIGPLFLAKAATLVKPDGFVAMVNTASLLYWRDGYGAAIRKKLFSTFTFDEVTNLSALRRELFTQAIGSACVFVFGTAIPDAQKTLYYFSPKPARSLKPKRGKPPGGQGFSIEPHDINTLTHKEAAEDSQLWPALALGGIRDAWLLRRLNQFPNLASLKLAGVVQSRMGIIPGNKAKEVTSLRKRRYFDAQQFPESVFLQMKAESAPVVDEIRVDTGHGIRDVSAFKNPQLLIKQSLVTELGRFRAALVKSSDPEWGVVCKKTYLSVRDLDPKETNIRAACVVYNSRLATYFLALTSSRIGHYITETLSEELVTVPLPSEAPRISTLHSFEAIDQATRNMFGLTTADWTLIEDFLEYTLPDVLRKTPGPARFQTQRKDKEGTKEPELTRYAKTFARVVKGTFGKDKAVGTTVYAEKHDKKLPVRMLTIRLDTPHRDDVRIEQMEADSLLDELSKFHAEQLKKKTGDATGSGLGFQRVAYLFQSVRENGNRVMNLTIVKPDERRYWTRAMAMRDADQLAAAIRKAATPRKTSA
jgi:N-6 DNA Methylase